MALEIVVTKKNTVKVMDKMFSISVNLTCVDNAIEVINKDFQETYKITSSLSKTFNELQIKMQKEIDSYNASQTIYKDVELDTKIAELQENLKG